MRCTQYSAITLCTMKIRLEILLVLILLTSCNYDSEPIQSNNSQEHKTEESIGSRLNSSADLREVKFTFQHSLRIPFKVVEVSIVPSKDHAKVSLKCDPMIYDGENWKSSPLDTIYRISRTDYDQIISTIESIQYSETMNHFNTTGTDGTMCILEYGSWQNSIKLSIWSPDADTKNRKLEEFLETCKLILWSAQLDPKEIF